MLTIAAGSRLAPRTRVANRLGRPALAFTTLILASSLLLQRFGLLIGTSNLSIVAPIGLGLALYGLWRGVLVFDARRLVIFVALAALIMADGAARAILPDAYATPSSWLSLLQFLGLTSFGLFVFATPVGERDFFRVINGLFTILALAGLTQFIVQFAGVGFFSFKGLFPDSVLIDGYNTVIPVGNGAYHKSNGLFLVEPSVFSQMMALAIIIEILVLRRPARLLVFSAGLVTSISGTGWIMIASFVLTAAFSLGLRGLVLAAATIAAGAVALGVLSLAFPSGFDLFMARTGEVYAIGSSGHDRFVTPWWLADFVVRRTPIALLFGVGAGTSDHLSMHPPWHYNTNPPVKILVEYGLPCLICYILFLLTAERTSTQRALMAPTLVLLLLDGGYSQFPPVLFPVLLLICVARLSPQPRCQPASAR